MPPAAAAPSSTTAATANGHRDGLGVITSVFAYIVSDGALGVCSAGFGVAFGGTTTTAPLRSGPISMFGCDCIEMRVVRST
jgi:hypothetical protein